MTDTQPIASKGIVLIQSQHDLHLCLPLSKNKEQISYQCPLCTYVTPIKTRLKYHIVVHTNHKLYECDICHSRFTQLNSMKLHRRKHLDEISKPFRCDDCDMAFAKRWMLKRHISYRHIKLKPHKCTECDYRCVQVSALRRHMIIHSRYMQPYVNNLRKDSDNENPSDLPHVCNDCGKAFKAFGHLASHVKYCPLKIKPHKCTECDYSSATIGKLRHHMSRHTGEKPYECYICHVRFNNLRLMKDHLYKHTNNENPSDSLSQDMSNIVKVE